MQVKEWIALKLPECGRSWVSDNYQTALNECESPVSSETYMRYIREAVALSADREAPESPRVDHEETKDTQNYTIVSSDIRTLDQLLDYCRVDLTKWEVTKFVTNSWGSEENPSFQCKAWLAKKTVESIEDIRNSFIDDVKQFAPVYPMIKYSKDDAEYALELCLYDLHYGQLSWGEEAGEDYDIKIAEERFINAIEHFVDKTKSFNISEILFPIGHDFFNSNSKENVTSHGTLQDEDTRFPKTFTNGRRMAVKAIDYLMQVAPVTVVILPGNHDTERTFYLGDSIYSWYHNCDSVLVDNSPAPQKYWKYGVNLLGMTHGSNEKFEELPLMMATHVPELWGTSKYREWHTGHLHKNEVMERQNVRIRRIPSLVANSAWATTKGYNSVREAQAFIWHKEKGLTSILNYRI